MQSFLKISMVNLSISFVLCLVSMPCKAIDREVLDLLARKKIITLEEYEQLKSGDADVQVTVKDGIKIKAKDNSFSAQIGTYFQADGTSTDDDTTSFSSGTEVRRSRISVGGTVLSDWDYKAELDFAGTT